MIALIRSEWIKLRTVRSNITMSCFAVALPLAITLLTTAFIDLDEVDDATVSVVLLGSGYLSVLLFGIIGVLAITQEYSQGTIRLTLAANPSRIRAYVAKGIVLAILSGGLTAFIILVGNTAGEAILDSRGAVGKLSNGDMGQPYLALIAMSILVSLLGMAIGTLTRNPPSAVTVLVLWPLLLEPLIGELLKKVIGDQIVKWMPFRTGLSALQYTHGDGFGRWGSVGYFGLWILAVSVFALGRFKRRDA
jgi:ABC-type transport system involved in multi-copper enzyme maturation permease subunit